MWTDLMCIKKESHRGRSLQVENLPNLSCVATRCLDARLGVSSIDSKHFYMVWRGMVGPLWYLCSNTLYFSDNLVKEVPKQRSVLFSLWFWGLLISCFLLSMLGDFSACASSVQMLWKIFPLLFLFNQGTVFFPLRPKMSSFNPSIYVEG